METRELVLVGWLHATIQSSASVARVCLTARACGRVPMTARLMATDSSQQELLVADFETALGTLPHARLRTSDVVAVRVPLQERGHDEIVPRTSVGQ